MKSNSLMTIKLFIIVFTVLFLVNSHAKKPTVPNPVSLNSDGKLVYLPDEFNNVVPDFSQVGYQGSNVPIPHINVVLRVKPIEGDNTAHLQNAINQVAALPLQENGFRGAILLEKGRYSVAGQLLISNNGIVIRGTGQSKSDTVIVAAGKDKRSLIHVKGSLNVQADKSSKQKIANPYVPVGSRSFEIADANGFQVGQSITVLRQATEQWISDIGMDRLPPRSDGRQTKQWVAKQYNLRYERTITSIQNNTITIDIPIVQMMQDKYTEGFIYPSDATGRVSQIGIENMMLISEYKKGKINSDEKHSWIAIEMTDVEHSWVSDVTAYHFAKSLVAVQRGSRFVTVRDSTNLDPASLIKGGRRYAFALTGSLSLFLRCNARNGRHDYSTSSRTTGPNAFVFGRATKTHSDIGPHHRWATGTLYDNISGGDFNIQDRQNLGTGHGWTGAQQVLWNTKGRGKTAVQSPPGAINWSIGHVGKRSKGRSPHRTQGLWVSHGKHVLPQSLFVQQLTERVGLQKTNAVLAKQNYKLEQ